MKALLNDLASTCRKILSEDPGPDGRTKVAAVLSDLLRDPAKADQLVPESAGQRDLLYQDDVLGFCILAHNYPGPKSAPPHDHGPTWAIYAQVRGETEMTDFEAVSPPTADVPGTVKATRTYTLRPGDAHVYDEGDLHAPARSAPTSLLRVEGMDLSNVKRDRYEAI